MPIKSGVAIGVVIVATANIIISSSGATSPELAQQSLRTSSPTAAADDCARVQHNELDQL
jgi:hypothetical protein